MKAKDRVVSLLMRAYRNPAWAHVPLTSNVLGPARRSRALKDYATENGQWIKVFDAYHLKRPMPKVVAGERPNLFKPLLESRPEIGIGILKNASVLYDHGWVITEDDAYIHDANVKFMDESINPRYAILRRPKPRVLRGPVLNLTSFQASYNFGHFLLDALSRVHIARTAGLTWSDFETILVPSFKSLDADWMFERLGLPKEKTLTIQRKESVLCETLFQPSFPGVTQDYEPWVGKFHRSLVPDQEQPTDDLYYVPRRAKVRRMKNEDEVEAYLQGRGFRSLNMAELSPTQLAGAKVVVGAHGAALTSIAFCKPGTKVVELMPSTHQHLYFLTLGMSCDHDYRLLVCKSEDHDPKEIYPFADFSVDMEHLRANIDEALGT
jgi:capsular polysaccharide biosynthesis protein